MLLYELHRTTLAMPLRILYPECSVFIADSPQLHPLICLRDQCHKNNACVERLVPRINALWDAFPLAQRLLLYFTYRHRESIGAAMFTRGWDKNPVLLKNPWGAESDDPVLNKSGWETFRQKSVVNTWEPALHLFESAPKPVLIRTPHEAAQVVIPKR